MMAGPWGYLILEDSSGNLWSVTVSSTGLLQRTSLGPGTTPPTYLNDIITRTTSWLVGITTSGDLTTTPAPYVGAPTAIALNTQNLIVSTDGLLELAPLEPVGYPGPLILEDSSGNLWTITATPDGLFQRALLGPGTAPPVYINDVATNTTSWLLSITTDGSLQLAPVTYSGGYPLDIPLNGYNLIVTTDELIESQPQPVGAFEEGAIFFVEQQNNYFVAAW
jgi:hypothetical protein